MFNPTQIVIAAFIRELRAMYGCTYGALEPGYPGVVSFVAQLALENIATNGTIDFVDRETTKFLESKGLSGAMFLRQWIVQTP